MASSRPGSAYMLLESSSHMCHHVLGRVSIDTGVADAASILILISFSHPSLRFSTEPQ